MDLRLLLSAALWIAAPPALAHHGTHDGVAAAGASTHRAEPVAGPKEAAANVHDVLRRLGQLTATPAAHTTLFIAGNVRTGHWTKLHPDTTPATIADHLRRLAAESTA